MRALTVLLFISLKKLNAAEYLNLMSRLRVLIETATPEALGLTAAEFEEFADLVDKLQRRVNWTSSSELTETLDLLDKQRDNLLSLLFGVISSYTSLPDTALGKAAIWLERVTRPYKSIQTAPAQQESVQINGLLLDLEAEEAKTHLATLHLTEQVAELKTINDQYVALTAQRARDAEADKQEPVRYTVQVLASAKPVSLRSSEFKSYRGKVRQLKASGALPYKYCVGEYDTEAAAQRHLRQVRKAFPDAFVVRCRGTEIVK